MEAAGVCRTDSHIFHSADGWGSPNPLLLGHEGAGVVEGVGPDITDLGIGDRVIIGSRITCGACATCDRGDPRRCSRSKPSPGMLRLSDGTLVSQPLGVGLFAERAVVDRRAAAPMPDRLEASHACLVGCAVSTGVGAVVNTARVWPRATVLVLGCGAVGLSVIQGARLAQARQITAVDVDREKLARAAQLGATHTIDAGDGDVSNDVMELTDGVGVDFAFEAVGLPETAEQAIRALAFAGVAVLIGVPRPGSEARIPLGRRRPGLFSNRGTVTVSHGGDSIPSIDFPRLAGLAASGELDLGRLVTAERSIHESARAFDDLEHRGTIRTVVRFER